MSIKYLPQCVLALLLLTLPVHAQDRCTLKIEQAPEMRGFQLGMSVPEVQSKLDTYWTSDFAKADEIGVREVHVYGIQLKDKETAKGIERITLEFLDDHLSYIEISYNTSVKWDNVDQFASAISEKLNLPNTWINTPSSSVTNSGMTVTAEGRKLVCSGFNVGAILTSNNYAALLIGEANLRAMKDKRRQALKEKQQQGFRP